MAAERLPAHSLASAGYSKKDQSGASVPILQGKLPSRQQIGHTVSRRSAAAERGKRGRSAACIHGRREVLLPGVRSYPGASRRVDDGHPRVAMLTELPKGRGRRSGFRGRRTRLQGQFPAPTGLPGCPRPTETK